MAACVLKLTGYVVSSVRNKLTFDDVLKKLVGIGVSAAGVLSVGGWLFYLTEHERMARNIVSGKLSTVKSQSGLYPLTPKLCPQWFCWSYRSKI